MPPGRPVGPYPLAPLPCVAASGGVGRHCQVDCPTYNYLNQLRIYTTEDSSGTKYYYLS